MYLIIKLFRRVRMGQYSHLYGLQDFFWPFKLDAPNIYVINMPCLHRITSPPHAPDRRTWQQKATLCGACGADGKAASACADCPLLGTRIAVIGGLKRMEEMYRASVDRLGGECLCHDGGLKGGRRRLRQMVAKADLVLFLTSVNSHAALSTVKKECKKCKKPFCALRQTGSGSLEKVLRAICGRLDSTFGFYE